MNNINKSHSLRSFLLSFRGFDVENAGNWLYLKSIKKHKKPNNIGIRDREILSLLPFDAQIDASLLPSGSKTPQLFADMLSTSKMLVRHSGLTPELYFCLLIRDGEQFYLPLGEAKEQYTADTEGVIGLLKDKGELCLRPSENSLRVTESIASYADGEYLIDGKKLTEAEFKDFICGLPENTVVTEKISSVFEPVLHIATLNRGKPEFLHALLTEEEACSKPDWYTKNRELAQVSGSGEYEQNGNTLRIDGFDSILGEILRISAEFTDLEYMSYSIRLTADGYKIIRIDTGIDLTYIENFSDKTAKFIRLKLSRHRRFVTLRQAAIIVYREIWRIRAERRGFMPLMYRNWCRSLKEDDRDVIMTEAEKKWAHDRGFLSFRIRQYNLTDDNYTACLSDRDYKWLRPLNNSYLKWVWDKVSLRYILDDYREHIPEYYYNIVRRDGKVVLLTMQDTPEGYEASFEDVIRLLREKKLLALKQTEGSHGVGFYKLEYADGKYLVNGEEKTEAEMLSFLGSLRKYYNISEYIVMHEDLRRIYSSVACTLRVMVINRHGYDPVIENVYYRIGTKRTGFTDNIGSGGVFAYVDEETGRYHDAEVIKNHVITPCPDHPDTGVRIEGVFPHWQEVRSEILDICKCISPLEYLGFDVVITDKGFKILEINTHQDLHRYPTYSSRVHEYFMHKLELKKQGKRLA